jgi:excisionase family DNA binding protein
MADPARVNIEEHDMLQLCESPFLTTEEAAKLLRIGRRTLANRRWEKTGPPYRRHGGRILYDREELLEWSRRHRGAPPPKKK